MKEKIITIEDATDPVKSVLKLKTVKVKFPLSEKDKSLIDMMKQLMLELGGVGLAAPQVNVNRNIAVIYIPENAALLRDDAVQYPLHAIVNAEYEPIEAEGKYDDFESCYSVKSIMGKVPRFRAIKVKYQNENGDKIMKIERGFYARVLQHEIDHLNGILITDRLTPDCLQGSHAEMLKLRRESLPEEKKLLFDKLVNQKSMIKEE